MSTYNVQQLTRLRSRAAEIERALQAQKAAQAQGFAAQQSALDAERERQLRQAYVSQQQALAGLPAQLGRLGINGGFAESSLLQLNRDYGNQRADINDRYMQEYSELLAKKAAADAAAAAQAAAQAAQTAQTAPVVQTGTASGTQTGTTQQKEPARKKPAGPGFKNDLVGHTALVR